MDGEMEFVVVPRSGRATEAPRTVNLHVDHWNDFSFVTMFFVRYFDSKGVEHELGQLKIGFKGQSEDQSTHSVLKSRFHKLDNSFFSLGQDVDYYKNLSNLPVDERDELARSIRDMVAHPSIYLEVEEERVLKTALLRYVSMSLVRGQYARVLQGAAELTDYKFSYVKSPSGDFDGLRIDFDVVAESTPSTSIHAIIGRNGVGKTTILNGMISAVMSPDAGNGFVSRDGYRETPVEKNYFSSLVSVSFSAFDPFDPPEEQPDPTKGTCYYYVGLKNRSGQGILRTIQELRADIAAGLIECFSNFRKCARWVAAIEKLNSDDVFASMDLLRLPELYAKLSGGNSTRDLGVFKGKMAQFLERLSSGHAIVLLTITKLVSRVEEKSLVLLDEPESHLHPPLLSAFVRALADLLQDRNGVAILATHSPVVLQELPKGCVYKVSRVRTKISVDPPRIETFGENVGILTSEVFGLEVARSGFHGLLAKSVDAGMNFDDVVNQYGGQLGFEARAILAALAHARGYDE